MNSTKITRTCNLIQQLRSLLWVNAYFILGRKMKNLQIEDILPAFYIFRQNSAKFVRILRERFDRMCCDVQIRFRFYANIVNQGA
ncbi:hypothetical protein BC351_29455 [Paenibacillus ferrarius]|uniref:Uncharacterized protein n=1 Tax=Paenibacillus ferrarius TaxID=1469647 RepID=A0A1V4HH64_9BACL|nr:hypothetical protein BC351_29455 [Paenibacillus ferrarius]